MFSIFVIFCFLKVYNFRPPKATTYCWFSACGNCLQTKRRTCGFTKSIPEHFYPPPCQGRPYSSLLTGGTVRPFDRPCGRSPPPLLERQPPGQGLGGCAGYDSGLRAHGRFRCPVICRKLVTGPPGPASSEYVPEDLPKRRTMLLNKADGKNRESENPEEISLLSGRNPTVVLEHRGERFETENRQRGKEVAQVVCEYDRNDKTPKGCPTGSCVNGRPPKLADGESGSPYDPLPGTILCSSVITSAPISWPWSGRGRVA